jgi:hypothetical protein
MASNIRARRAGRPGHARFRESIVISPAPPFDERDSGHTEVRVFGKTGHEEFENVGFERQVGIEVPDDIVGGLPDGGIAGGERIGLGRELTGGVLRAPDVYDPGVAGGVILNDLIGPVR